MIRTCACALASSLIMVSTGFAQSPAKPLTKQEVSSFARDLQASLAKGQGAAFDRAVDLDRLLHEALASVSGATKSKEDYCTGFKRSFSFGPELVQTLGSQGHYTFLRALSSEGPQARFRLVTPEGGINYHDLCLERDASGRIRIFDAYFHLPGERLSESLRRSFVLAHSDQTEHPGSRGQRLYSQAIAAYREKRHDAAWQLLERLPPRWRQLPSTLAFRLRVAQHLGPDALDRVCREFARAHPRSTARPLVLLDIHAGRKAWEAFLETLDALEASIGDDPYLNVPRAKAALACQDPTRAQTLLEETVKEEPTLAAAHIHLVDAALLTQDWAVVARELTTLERDFGVEWQDLSQAPLFAGFTQSAEYRKWLERKRPPKKR